MIFLDVVLVVVEVAAWSSSKERKRRGREEGEDGWEGGRTGQCDRERDRGRDDVELFFVGQFYANYQLKNP